MSGPFRRPSLAGRPLRPASDHRFGAPLPHQLPNRPPAPPSAPPKQLSAPPLPLVCVCGIDPTFVGGSPTKGQVTDVFLSRSPLPPGRSQKSVRLACLRHAASVDPEPGSNSPLELSEGYDPEIAVLTQSYRVALLLVARRSAGSAVRNPKITTDWADRLPEGSTFALLL